MSEAQSEEEDSTDDEEEEEELLGEGELFISTALMQPALWI